MFLHGKKGLGKKDRKGWHHEKILVHLKEFGPSHTSLCLLGMCDNGSTTQPFLFLKAPGESS